MLDNTQFSLDFWWNLELNTDFLEFRDIIVDRKSKYTVAAWKIEKLEEVKQFIFELNKDKYYKKSTHNTYAYRIKSENWSIIEWKNDDWETWAGMCILREMQRENCAGMIIVVTRYFWGIHLQSDRFKNVIDASKYIIDKIKSWQN